MKTVSVEFLESASDLMIFAINASGCNLIDQIIRSVIILREYDSSFSEEEMMFIFAQQVKKQNKIKYNDKELYASVMSSVNTLLQYFEQDEEKLKYVKNIYSLVINSNTFSENEYCFGTYLLEAFSIDTELAKEIVYELEEEIKYDNPEFEDFEKNSISIENSNKHLLREINKEFTKKRPLTVNHELPQITDHEKLYFNFTPHEINNICRAVRETKVIPFFSFISDILVQRYPEAEKPISWFLPKVTLYDRINCSLFISPDAIYANSISGNEMIPVFRIDEIDSIDLTCKKIDGLTPNKYRFRLLLQSELNYCLTVDLIENQNRVSQLMILAEILTLYKTISQICHDISVPDYSDPDCPTYSFFDSWNHFFDFIE